MKQFRCVFAMHSVALFLLYAMAAMADDSHASNQKHDPVIVFLSTGRCGTQFFTDYLNQAAAGQAIVLHEPLGPYYAPRKTLRASNPEEMLAKNPKIKNHFEWIKKLKNNGGLYIETGWPIFPWISYLFDLLGKDLIVVHLIRHPIRFAFSMNTHRLFSATRNDDFANLAALHPTDPGTFFKKYSPIWDSLNSVEKCLYQWLEINRVAEELKLKYPKQIITLKSEILLEQPRMLLDKLVAVNPNLAHFFINPPQKTKLVDKWHFKTTEKIKTLRYAPEIARLAAKYGYNMTIDKELQNRFMNTNTIPATLLFKPQVISKK